MTRESNRGAVDTSAHPHYDGDVTLKRTLAIAIVKRRKDQSAEVQV